MSNNFSDNKESTKAPNYEKRIFILYTFGSCGWLFSSILWWVHAAATAVSSSDSFPYNLFIAIINTCIFVVNFNIAIEYYHLYKAALRTGQIRTE